MQFELPSLRMLRYCPRPSPATYLGRPPFHPTTPMILYVLVGPRFGMPLIYTAFSTLLAEHHLFHSSIRFQGRKTERQPRMLF